MFCDTCKTLALARPPVKVFKTLNDRQSYIFRKFQKSKKNPAKSNYHMSIKKSQEKFTENIGLPVI